MKRVMIAAVVAAVMAVAGTAQALEFSADMVSTAAGQQVSGKIYVANDKVRMEMPGATTITRIDAKVVWVIMPEQEMYMEQPFDPEKIAGATEKMPGEIERTPLGTEAVDGKEAQMYRITYTSKAAEATVLQWVDKASGIPVKTEAEDGSWSMEYRNLVIGAPDASLFEIPSGYKKFALPNMANMMQALQENRAGEE